MSISKTAKLQAGKIEYKAKPEDWTGLKCQIWGWWVTHIDKNVSIPREYFSKSFHVFECFVFSSQ